VNINYFSYLYSDEKTYNYKFVELFGEPRPREMNFFTSDTRYPTYFGEKPSDFEALCKINEHYADIAASIQKVTEEILLKLVINLHKETGLKDICMPGVWG
jgi:carbamoyltransferase